MASRRLLLWMLAVLAAPGCRIPGWDGPVSHSLASSRQLCQQGVAAMEREQWERAEQLLQQAVRTCAGDPDSRRNYAEALWRRQSPEQAITQIEEACRLAPESADLHVRAAEMLLAVGRIDASIDHARRALELDPRLSAAWAMRGRIFAATGQFSEALASYHRAVGYDPSDRGIQLEIAEVYRRLDQPQQALVVLQNLADSYSPGEEPQRLLFLQGLAYQALGRYDEAVGDLQAATRRDTPTPEILEPLGRCLVAMGRHAEAAQVGREMVALAPNDPRGQGLLSEIEIAQQQPTDILQR